MKKVSQHLIKFLVAFGKAYQPGILPEDVERGKVGDCFDFCMLIAMRDQRFRYVEGIAKDPVTGEWVLHAWLTDPLGVQAYDPTWAAHYKGMEIPVPTVYRGIQIDLMDLLEFVKATEYKSVFANGWRNRELANKALGQDLFQEVAQ